ncbi:MAG TPA: hypothetical protein VLE27_11110 [Thermoanaerobaculia bacterium]|nr:hypothetical protein [Thermoanaerobaculia bacterium]
MSSCTPRRVLPVLAVLAGLALPFPTEAAVQRSRPAILESLPGSLWSWAARLWPGTLQKNGAMIDPDGKPTPVDGTNTTTPPGAGAGDNGAQTDPDG